MNRFHILIENPGFHMQHGVGDVVLLREKYILSLPLCELTSCSWAGSRFLASHFRGKGCPLQPREVLWLLL